MQQRAEQRENWFDGEFVQTWIDREEDRKDLRERQFAIIAAMVPHRRDDAFRYINIGAGPGRLDELLLTRFPHAEAILVDGSSVMLDHARELLTPFGSRSSFVQADLADSAWVQSIDGPVDLAVSSIAIHNLRDPRRIKALYAEIFNLLSDGGFFMNLEYARLSNPQLTPLILWAAQDRVAGLGSGGGGGGAGTLDEQLIWLREAGFWPADCFWRALRVALIGGFKGEVRVPEAPRPV